jgi:hypothetical protein
VTGRVIDGSIVNLCEMFYKKTFKDTFFLIHTNLVLINHLKYLSIGNSLFLTIRSKQINDSD